MSSLAGKRAIVIGAGFGGLSVAAHLSKKGAHVHVFERAASVGGKAARIEQDGFVFDAGPTLLTMPDELRRAFSAARAEHLFPRLTRIDPSVRYLFANKRDLLIWDDPKRTQEGISKIDANDGAAYLEFLAECERISRVAGAPYLEAPFDGYLDFARRMMKRGSEAVKVGMTLGTLEEFANKWFRSPEMRMLVGRFATYAGGSPSHSSAAFAMIAHLEMVEGAFYPEGGMQALAERLYEGLVRAGVTFSFHSDVNGFVGDRSQIRGVRVNEEEVLSDFVVADVDPAAALFKGSPFRPNARQEARLPSLSGFVLAFGFQGPSPTEAVHNVLFPADARAEFRDIFEEKRAPRDPAIYLSVPSLLDPARAKEGHHVALAMINAPAAHDPAYWERETPSIRDRILDGLERRLLPDLRRRIVAEVVRTPIDLRKTGAPFGEIYGAAPHGKFAPFERPANRSPFAGLYFVGGATHPGGGVPLVTRGGRFVADLIEKDLA